MLFGDNLESIDLRNLNDVPLQHLGIHLNPNDRNQMWFMTDAGMGYGDIIRVCFYARTLARRYRRRVKIVFTILEVTDEYNINSKIADKNKRRTVFRAEEEIPKIEKVISYYSNALEGVSWTIVPMSNLDFSRHAFGNHIPFLLPTRSLAVTNWLGVPYLEPNDRPEKGNHIAVWTTKTNLTQVADWKDPIGPDKMEDLFNHLDSQGEDIQRISYRHSIEHVFETIRTAKFCIGYEGIGNLIAQSYRKPCLVYSKNQYHSRVTSGMWAEVSPVFQIKHKYINDMMLEQEEVIARGNPRKNNNLSMRDLEFFKSYL